MYHLGVIQVRVVKSVKLWREKSYYPKAPHYLGSLASQTLLPALFQKGKRKGEQESLTGQILLSPLFQERKEKRGDKRVDLASKATHHLYKILKSLMCSYTSKLKVVQFL